jgi:hypothetical protein
VLFQRLLLGKQDRKQFILTNPGVLPGPNLPSCSA